MKIIKTKLYPENDKSKDTVLYPETSADQIPDLLEFLANNGINGDSVSRNLYRHFLECSAITSTPVTTYTFFFDFYSYSNEKLSINDIISSLKNIPVTGLRKTGTTGAGNIIFLLNTIEDDNDDINIVWNSTTGSSIGNTIVSINAIEITNYDIKEVQ